MKYKITVNDQSPFSIEVGSPEEGDKMEQILLNEKAIEWSCEQVAPDVFSVLYQNESFRCECLGIDRDKKIVRMGVDGKEMEVKIYEPIDQVLENMGWEAEGEQKIKQITSPMPGMVLKVHVSEGQQLKKGDPILVLEAMKMENVFKAAEEAIVKEVKVKEHTAVEKGVVLVVLE